MMRWRWVAVVGAVVAVIALVVVVRPGGAPDGRGGGVVVDAGGSMSPRPAPVAIAPGAPDDGKQSRGLPVSIEPTSAHHDGQILAVAGSDFTPVTDVGIVQCSTQARLGGGVGFCDTSRVSRVRTDATGAFAGSFTLRRFLKTPNTGVIDCGEPVDACVVAAGNISDYDESGAAPLTWDGSPPPTPPTLTVEPALVEEGRPVDVLGAGLSPGSPQNLLQCRTAPGATPASRVCLSLFDERPITVDGDGGFRIRVYPMRFLLRGMPDQIDCAVVECVLETADDPTGRQASAPLRFDPTAPPPPPPTVAVEPAGAPRSDNERLTISGRHFVPEETVWLSQCPEPTDEGSCGPFEPVRVTVGDGGGFTTSFVVRARLPFGGRDVDCRRERCVLLIGTRSGPPLRVPLRFRSD